MPVAFKTEHGQPRRNEIFAVHPLDIIARDNGSRHYEFDQEKIESLKESFRERGQLQPCVVTKRPGSKQLHLVAGFRRWHAACQLVEEDPNFSLLVKIVSPQDERESFFDNVTENMEREDLSKVDKAYIAQRMIDVYHQHPADVAKFLKCSQSQVGILLEICGYPEDVQEQIHRGVLPDEGAMHLATLDHGERKKVMEDLEERRKGTNRKKWGNDQVKRAIQKLDPEFQGKEEAEEEVEEQPRKKRGRPKKGSEGKVLREAQDNQLRSVEELVEFLEGKQGPGEHMLVRDLCKDFLNYLHGRIDEELLSENLDGYAEMEPATV